MLRAYSRYIVRAIAASREFSTFIPAFFFFNDTATTEIYTLSLHDAPPIPPRTSVGVLAIGSENSAVIVHAPAARMRSEEHTSELQSHVNLVCRLLLEK